ncbi:MAG: sugar phosphate nucleotidyltransferase [Gemmatimonadota bacterium]|jgi:glucose-1-phosphate thymidylyltransferase
MKAIIPLAGKGTRLRPHTHLTPKPLVKVGGRPVMSYILDDLVAHGIREIVFIVGYLQDAIRAYIAEAYPDVRAHYVVQEVQDGTAGAIKLAEPWADEDLLILFVDTLFDADLDLISSLDDGYAGVIWAKEVEDYQRFGVIVTRDDGTMERIVEKPTEPISRLANIGLYYIRDYDLLFEGVNHALDRTPGPGGEYYLTDAFQYMVDHGAKILTAPVEGWYDCGKPGTLLETNDHLLRTGRGVVEDGADVEGAEIVQPVRIEAGCVVKGGTIGPNVTLEKGTRVTESTLRDCIVGARATISRSDLHDSLVGGDASVDGFRGRLSVIDHSEIAG